jgi:hypothetical protein
MNGDVSLGSKFFWAIVALGVFCGLGWLAVRAEPFPIQGVVIPEGFQLIKDAAGVELFKKSYPNGTPDYVQIIRLDQGAAIKLLHGSITADRPGKGVFGGNDARFQLKSLQSFWKNSKSAMDSVFCVTNGQFFYMPESPTRLTLPLKVDGQVVTDGFGADQFIGKRLMLELWSGHADIRELSAETLYQSSAPDIIGGLSAQANRRAKDYTGRTFAGVDDLNEDGLYETIYIFNTRTARQVDADAILKSFGADKTMMLDGGGSTQLICQGENFIKSERLIPQALAIVAGNSGVSSILQISQSEPQDESGVDLPLVVEQDTLVELGESQPVEGNSPSPNTVSGEAGTSIESVELGNLVTIPLIMVPVALVVLFIAMRVRQVEQEY